MSLGLLFPGQGSQQVGMGCDLSTRFPLARETFAEADDVLGFGLSRLAWEGPFETLTATENAQPALYVHSMAVHRVLAGRLGRVRVAAGHSLGELSAWGAAGVYSFADGLRAVRRRGELMARADRESPGSMAAILGLGVPAIHELCRDARDRGMTLVAANLNAKGQVVVSGETAAIEWVDGPARKKGARRVVQLPVSAAFHSPLMEPAAGEFRQYLGGITFRPPDFPVVSNVTAETVADPASIRELLVRQLVSPVRWTECIQRMCALGVDRFAEIGSGKVLTGLNKRNARGVRTDAFGHPEDIDALETDG